MKTVYPSQEIDFLIPYEHSAAWLFIWFLKDDCSFSMVIKGVSSWFECQNKLLKVSIFSDIFVDNGFSGTHYVLAQFWD